MKVCRVHDAIAEPLPDGSFVRTTLGDILRKWDAVLFDTRDVRTPDTPFFKKASNGEGCHTTNLYMPGRFAIPSLWVVRGVSCSVPSSKVHVRLRNGDTYLDDTVSAVVSKLERATCWKQDHRQMGRYGAGYVPKEKQGVFTPIGPFLIQGASLSEKPTIEAFVTLPESARRVVLFLHGEEFVPVWNEEYDDPRITPFIGRGKRLPTK